MGYIYIYIINWGHFIHSKKLSTVTLKNLCRLTNLLFFRACHSEVGLMKNLKNGLMKCKLCNKSFRFMLKRIDHHMRTAHSITIYQYFYDHIRKPLTFTIWKSNPPWICEVKKRLIIFPIKTTLTFFIRFVSIRILIERLSHIT